MDMKLFSLFPKVLW